MRICISLWLAGAVLLASSVSAVHAAEVYRYTNAQGNTVVDDRVPPEFVKNGYEVLNEKGHVVRVVPRELTGEELLAAEARKSEAQRAAEAAEKQREHDELLMLRYSSIEDIEAAKSRALSELQIHLSILKSNKRNLKQQVESYQAQAAESERLGRPVSLEHSEAIDELQRQMVRADVDIAEREREMEAVAAAYDADIARFGQLLDKVNYRRQASSGS